MSDERRVRGVWPDPGMQPLARSRAMAAEYRNAVIQLQDVLNQLRVLADDPEAAEAIRKVLAEAPADPVDALNRQFFEWGERWHVPELLDMEFDDDDWVPMWIAADIARLNETSLGVHRGNGLFSGYYFAGKQWKFLYRVGDLREHRRKGYRPVSGRGSAGGVKSRRKPKYD